MTAKVTNDAVAFIRSLAELRGRNADWAEKAVREAATLSANGALQANVIDFIARDPAELLRQVDGRVVEVAGGKTHAWRRRMPSSKPSIPDGPPERWPSSLTPMSRSFS